MRESQAKSIEQPKTMTLPTDPEAVFWNVMLFLGVSTVLTTLLRML